MVSADGGMRPGVRGLQALDGRLDDLERTPRLAGEVRGKRPVGVHPDRSADRDGVPAADGPAVAYLSLPGRSAEGTLAAGVLSYLDIDGQGSNPLVDETPILL